MPVNPDADRPLWGPVRSPGRTGPMPPPPPGASPAPPGPVVPAPRDPGWAGLPRPSHPPSFPAPPIQAFAAPPTVVPAVPLQASFAPPPERSGPPGPARRSTPLLVAAAVAAVVVAVVVGVVALSGPNRQQVPAATAAPPAPAVAPARPTPTAAARPTTTAAAQPRAPLTSLTSPSGTVEIAGAAAADPAAATVLALLDRHFMAINEHDYATWSTTVVDRRARDQPESRWTADYRSTHDSSVQVTAIADTGPDTVTVTLAFVSEQDPSDAPTDLPAGRICWQSRWPVVGVSSGGRLDRPASGTTTRQAC